MFHALVCRNKDLKQLVEKGYAVGFDSNYLIVRDIPYLDAAGSVQWGAIVTKLVDLGDDRVAQHDHEVFFAGSAPYEVDGTPIRNLGGAEAQLALSAASEDVVVQRTFSNKPRNDAGELVAYKDFFEKIHRYVTIISGPAMERYGVTPYTFRTVEEAPSDSPFKVRDTLTSRAEITDLSAKFKPEVVAIIGLGGTGAYLLDFLVKTPVKEIRAFDPDVFHVHTAFRSPGRLDHNNDLGKRKAEVYRRRYENFRRGLTVEPTFIDATSAAELDGITFAFVCVDKGSSRAGIFDGLIQRGIPFIDVGMGLHREADILNGMMRVTHYPSDNGQVVRDKGWAELADAPDDEYRTTIQIAELNALNACLAVIRYKQLRGFYLEAKAYFHLLFVLSSMKILGETGLDAN